MTQRTALAYDNIQYFDEVSPQDMVTQAIDSLPSGGVGEIMKMVINTYPDLTLDMEAIAIEVVEQVDSTKTGIVENMVAESITELLECSSEPPKPGMILTHILTKTMGEEMDMNRITRAIFGQLEVLES